MHFLGEIGENIKINGNASSGNHCTVNNVFHSGIFSKCEHIFLETADLIPFAENIFNGNVIYCEVDFTLFSFWAYFIKSKIWTFYHLREKV